MQAWMGIPQDGYIGPQFIKALQRKMGKSQDGILSNPSQCITALQKYLNQH
jgi:peptidoglycan hydrolase-like protein with peptidoglycan-binding domain